MSCPDCGDTGRTCIAVIVAERKLVKRAGALSTEPMLAAHFEAARCDCQTGRGFSNMLDRATLLDAMRGPAGLQRYPSAVDVVELGRPHGHRYAAALAEVWAGGPVTHEQRQHAWRAARTLPQVAEGAMVLDAGPAPEVRTQGEARKTWHDRPDAETFETERVGGWV